MNRNRMILTLLSAIAIACPVQSYAKKRPSVSAEFGTAKTIFVETSQGDITDLALDREDRNAILEVQDGFERWGRYSLSRSRLDADLIVVLHRGLVSRDPSNSNGSSPLGSRNSSSRPTLQNPSDASSGTGEAASQDGVRREKDRLDVYTLGAKGKLKGPIWSEEFDRGLEAPRDFLLERLKSEVEKTYPSASTPKQTTP